jgi:hypothetical protein
VTNASSLESRAMPRASSAPLPPRKVDQPRALPLELTLVTKASVPPPYVVWAAPLVVGYALSLVDPAM